MTSLVLHIGPPKCGSTSIQQFFATQKRPCVEKTYYTTLTTSEISELNCEEPSKSTLKMFTKLLVANLTRSDVLVLSHEHLFQCPYAIKHICDLAKSLVTKISIIGYSRRQSEFLISSYSQWGFRLPDQIEYSTIVLNKCELDPVLFPGLEQQLIALIANGFYDPRYEKYSICDWYNSYNAITKLTHESGAMIKCGILPSKESSNNLIQDFCEKAALTLRDEIKTATWPVFNPRFNQDIIEAINNAVAFGLDMPGPDENNEVLELLSANIVNTPSNSSEFLSNLKSYIDTYFLSSNHQFCQLYGLNETYFVPSTQLSKQEIMDLIVHEGQQRALNKSIIINNYRMLSARMIELCLKLIKENPPVQVDTRITDPSILRALRKLYKY